MSELTPEFLDRWSAESVMGWTLLEDVDQEYRGQVFKDAHGKLWITRNTYEAPGYPDNWRPSDPDTGQIWIVDAEMAKLGFKLRLVRRLYVQPDAIWRAWYIKEDDEKYWEYFNEAENPCLAALKAAYEAVEGI